MQFTHDIGIIATKAELEALLIFSKDTDEAKVTIRVDRGKLLAVATTGRSAVYHHGEAWDGAGKPAVERSIWQVSVDLLRRLNKGIGSDEELLLSVDSSCRLVQALIRTVEDNETKQKCDLDGFVTEQLEFDLFGIPSRPPRDYRALRTPEFLLGFSQLDALKKVTKAANTDAVRFYVAKAANNPVYIEVDQLKRLADEDQSRWVCVFTPIQIDDGDEGGAVRREIDRAVKGFERLGEDLGCSVTMTTSDGVATELTKRSKKGREKAAAAKQDGSPKFKELEDAEDNGIIDA